MSTIQKYTIEHEPELLALLANEPDWHSFTRDDAIERFKKALRTSETYICVSQDAICGYLSALVDGFGIYVSELYIAPAHRGHGHGAKLLRQIKQAHLDQDVYVLSDEDSYYQKLGCQRVGSVFKL